MAKALKVKLVSSAVLPVKHVDDIPKERKDRSLSNVCCRFFNAQGIIETTCI